MFSSSLLPKKGENLNNSYLDAFRVLILTLTDCSLLLRENDLLYYRDLWGSSYCAEATLFCDNIVCLKMTVSDWLKSCHVSKLLAARHLNGFGAHSSKFYVCEKKTKHVALDGVVYFFFI